LKILIDVYSWTEEWEWRGTSIWFLNHVQLQIPTYAFSTTLAYDISIGDIHIFRKTMSLPLSVTDKML